MPREQLEVGEQGMGGTFEIWKCGHNGDKSARIPRKIKTFSRDKKIFMLEPKLSSDGAWTTRLWSTTSPSSPSSRSSKVVEQVPTCRGASLPSSATGRATDLRKTGNGIQTKVMLSLAQSVQTKASINLYVIWPEWPAGNIEHKFSICSH